MLGILFMSKSPSYERIKPYVALNRKRTRAARYIAEKLFYLILLYEPYITSNPFLFQNLIDDFTNSLTPVELEVIRHFQKHWELIAKNRKAIDVISRNIDSKQWDIRWPNL